MSVSVSVIVPVYNTGKYLSECLNSLLNQNFDDYEIVAVNDGSTDNSGEILKDYSEKHSRMKVITQENKGLGGARNTGIENAQGKYILFLDSDDTFKDCTLRDLYIDAQESDADIVWFGMDYINADGNSYLTKKPNDNGNILVTQDERPLLYANDSYVANKLFKRSLFVDNNIKFPQRAWFEDLRTLPKLVLKADKILLTDKICYNYLQRSDSIMHTQNVDRMTEMIDAVSDVVDYYKKQGTFEKYYEDLEYMAALHIMVFATLRVALVDANHPLLKEFYDFTKSNFPDFKKNKKIKQYFTFRHKIIFMFSKNKMYNMLKLLDKVNKLR